MRSLLLFSFLLFVALARICCGYGPTGHSIVGAIADERLAGTPAGSKVRSLLQGMTLAKAALVPDEIKGWDKKGVDDPTIFRYRSRPELDEQLAAFWRANPPTHNRRSRIPSHHWFHYTDVPLTPPQRYSDGKIGRSQWDVVQTINYCVKVLRGELGENNARKITKPVAVVLLAHLVGDIHQPLHVGAEYFDPEGDMVDPQRRPAAFHAQGGNTISLKLSKEAQQRLGQRRVKLHGFWDNQAVALNLPPLSKELSKEERREITDAARAKLVADFVARQPADWKLPIATPIDQYAETWANQILPIAGEAHDRLDFINIQLSSDQGGNTFATGQAEEKADAEPYHQWAADVVHTQLHKAGWRLADLLQQALR